MLLPPKSIWILALFVTFAKAKFFKIGDIQDKSPADISGQVFMKDDNTIVIKDFTIEHGLAGERTGYFLLGRKFLGNSDISTPPRKVDFEKRTYKYSETYQIEDESSLLHYSLDGVAFQYNDENLPLINGTHGFYRKELILTTPQEFKVEDIKWLAVYDLYPGYKQAELTFERLYTIQNI